MPGTVNLANQVFVKPVIVGGVCVAADKFVLQEKYLNIITFVSILQHIILNLTSHQFNCIQIFKSLVTRHKHYYCHHIDIKITFHLFYFGETFTHILFFDY